MKIPSLKILRIILSLIFFLGTLFVFLDSWETVGPGLKRSLVFLQFSPSLLHFITVICFGGTGFIIILILTALFGRVYCSSICPLGILQDIITFLAKKFKIKKYFKYTKPVNWLRYSFLAVTVIFLIFGSVFLLNLLDPFSNFGRISMHLFKPVLAGANNLLVNVLERSDIYSVFPVEIKAFNILSFFFTLSVLILLLWMAGSRGRLFCNTVCPVGTLLGLLSRVSVFRIRFNKDACISCGLCERVCKAGCIDTKNMHIDLSRCIDCYNCFRVCPVDGIGYRNSLVRAGNTFSGEPSENRRAFIAGSVLGLFSLSAFSKGKNKLQPSKDTTFPVIKKYPACPPGSLSIDHFTDRCTACHLCVSACPTQVLQPSFLEYGFLGIMQPQMDYWTGYCNFECVACTKVCPSGAILPVSKEEKKTLQIGVAKFVMGNCVVHTDKTDCGACSEHCPTKAVYMVPYLGNLAIPEVNEEICIGCGACEYACPTTPFKAIYVDGNPEHLTAKKPEKEKIEEADPDEDFPF